MWFILCAHSRVDRSNTGYVWDILIPKNYLFIRNSNLTVLSFYLLNLVTLIGSDKKRVKKNLRVCCARATEINRATVQAGNGEVAEVITLLAGLPWILRADV